MRAVLDANIIVSAANGFLPPVTGLGSLLRAGFRGRYTIVTSDHIVEEVRFALSKPFFASRLAPGVVEGIVAGLTRHAQSVDIDQGIKGVATHWQDDLVLETALSGEADFLVTGDRELLELVHPFPFRIVLPGEFIAILEDSNSG